MTKEYKGKLTARKTKKGYHIEIHYERGGTPKRIPFQARDFPCEFQNLEVLFELEGNRIVRIKKISGEVLWEQKSGRSHRESGRKPPEKGSSESPPPSRGSLSLKAHRYAIRFIAPIGYWPKEFNPALRFNKFLRWDRDKQKFDYGLTLGTNNSGVYQQELDVPQEIQERINALQTIPMPDALVCTWRAKTTWRMVIGLGSPHVHETAMTWHHTWSIPYIPGSALKGVTRSWFIQKLWEDFAESDSDAVWEETVPCLEAWLMDAGHPPEKDVNHDKTTCAVIPWAKSTLSDEKGLFKLLFGTQEQKGAVIFMDAFPVNKYTLKLDVMNVHYPKYYRGEKDYAADWESPNPVFFLTLVDTEFQGLVIVNRRFFNHLKEKGSYSEGELAEKAVELLKDALENQGIGAKTSVGYGLLQVRG